MIGQIIEGCPIHSCVTLVSLHGLKNDDGYMCTALVSRHGLKNDVIFHV